MESEKILRCTMCDQTFRHTLCRYSLCHKAICDNCGEDVAASFMDICQDMSEVIYACHKFIAVYWNMRRRCELRDRCRECNVGLEDGVNCNIHPTLCNDCAHREVVDEMVYSNVKTLEEAKNSGLEYIEFLVADNHRYNDPLHFNTE